MQALVLAMYDLDLKIIMKIDASDFAFGACLSQKHDGKLQPIAYHSRTFSLAKLNYDIYNKELLAIVVVCK